MVVDVLKRNTNEEMYMKNNLIENNQVTITGEIISEFTYSHEIYGVDLYMMDVSVQRISGNLDIIPVMISEHLIDISADYKDMIIKVNGQFRSWNQRDEGKSRLILYVYAREIEFIENIPYGAISNQIYLDGYLCKEPVYRKTPLNREITDLLLAVNKSYGKSDYIPCICWGKSARYASNLSVGERCIILGRIQSRNYIKKTDDENMEPRIAFEVSASRINS